MGKTLFEKIWAPHVVRELADGACLLYIDRHLVHEVTSPQAFDGLRLAGRRIRRPELTLSTMDHKRPYHRRPHGHQRPRLEGPGGGAAAELRCLRGQPVRAWGDDRQGIVHVIGPELGITLPGLTIVCGDSHTSTHGAFGALAFGIGTSEVEHVLVTQTLVQKKPRTCRGWNSPVAPDRTSSPRTWY